MVGPWASHFSLPEPLFPHPKLVAEEHGKDSKRCLWNREGCVGDVTRPLRTGLWGRHRVIYFLGLQGHWGQEREIRICLEDTSTAVSHVRQETSVPSQAPYPQQPAGVGGWGGTSPWGEGTTLGQAGFAPSLAAPFGWQSLHTGSPGD